VHRHFSERDVRGGAQSAAPSDHHEVVRQKGERRQMILDPLPAHLRRVATERLHALLGTVRDVPCEALVEESTRAWHAILGAAAKYEADLVVLGSHGYDLVDRLLGTTAAKVVNMSTRDVYVVH
jgi:nucleotide-binding universal stress UspA family protein